MQKCKILILNFVEETRINLWIEEIATVTEYHLEVKTKKYNIPIVNN